AREGEGAAAAVHSENRDRVAALVAAIEEAARWVETEAARVIPPRPLFADELQVAVRSDGKDADAVMQPVARVDVLPVGGDQDLGAEVAAGEAGGQGGDRLPRAQA